MGIPIKYRRGAEEAIATYDFVDIASGTGYIRFYGANISGSQVSNQILSNIAFYSHPTGTSGAEAGAVYAKKVDLDFDVTFNKQMVLKGDAIINLPWTLSNSSTDTVQGFVHTYIKKWDGTTETNLGNISGAILNVGSSATDGRLEAFKINIPQTIFKKNQTLRLTTEGWAKSGGAGTATIKIWHDPQNRTTSVSEVPSSILDVQIPTRINL